MRHALTRHPDCRQDPVTGLGVDVRRDGDALALRYVLTGATGGLILPPPAAGERADELWRHTCFEAFVRGPAGTGYFELNFSPSTRWAAYRFDGYRRGMTPAREVAPQVEARVADHGVELRAAVTLPLAADAAWRIGLSAVIQAADGGLTYWALAHPPGRADFHHLDGFALELPATAARRGPA